MILWDINKSMLQDTEKELKQIKPFLQCSSLTRSDASVYSYVVDLSNRENIMSGCCFTVMGSEVARQVKKELGDIDVLVNNGMCELLI